MDFGSHSVSQGDLKRVIVFVSVEIVGIVQDAVRDSICDLKPAVLKGLSLGINCVAVIRDYSAV